MSTITAARLAYKASNATTDAQCVRIERVDGVILRLTDATENLVMSKYIDRSGVEQSLPSDVTYVSTAYTATSTASGQNFDPGTVDLDGVLSSAGVSRSDMLKGLYDQARIFVFITDYTTPVEDEEKITAGFYGESELKDGVFSTTFRSLAEVMTTRTGYSYSPMCTAKLGDSRCKVQVSALAWVTLTSYNTTGSRDASTGHVVKPTSQTGFYYKCIVNGTSGVSEPTWPTTIGVTVVDGTVTWETIAPYVLNGTVVSSADNLHFVGTTSAQALSWWKSGKVEFTSGTNSGVVADIKIFNSGAFTLKQALPFDLTASDGYTVTVGCQKRLTDDCVGKFDNVYNNRSHPWMPGRGVMGKFGGQ